MGRKEEALKSTSKKTKALLRGLFLPLVFTLAILFLGYPASGFAKMYEEPRSFSLQDKSLEQVERKVLKKIDPKSLLAEDRKRGKDARRPGPLRFAVTEEVAFNLENSGTWQTVSDGRIWRLIIQSPGAVSQNLGITRFDLPKGAKLWIYDPGRKQVEGPYTSNHRSRHGRLWTPIIKGDEIVVELFVPSGAPKAGIVISKVNKGYRAFDKEGIDKSGACNIDVICPEGNPWRDQIRSVALYSINGTSLCSGQLVNNTSIDKTPYFLSANHCGVDTTNDDTLVFYWNFESPHCGDHCCGSLSDSQLGAIFRASYAMSDFVLVELAAAPDPAFNVFYTGWDATGATPASVVGIHHPSGDEKAISFENDPLTSTAYLSNTVNATANHWRVEDWDDGTTEPGSSGSCLWDTASKRCVGQLHGGYAACGNNDSDWYGKFSVSWDGGGTNDTRLRNWLDPGGTGTLAIDGDPHITTADGIHYDFQGAGEYTVLRNRDLEIQTRQAPIATTFNPGPNPYHGLATCVSLNTALAGRVGNRRVTYQPNISGVPDPSGLQLRVDGNLTTLGANGIDLGNGGRISKTATPGGLEIEFSDNSVLLVTPGWWASQSKWYLNVEVVRAGSVGGIDGASGNSSRIPTMGGLMGSIVPDSWLPALPDGSSMGPLPSSLHQRYIDLYQKFGEAWRVTDETSLFDYAPGNSTKTFTMRAWPLENPPCVIPETEPVKPMSKLVAERACRGLKDKAAFKNCVFDVMVTGETGFAKTYLASQHVLAVSTKTTVTDDENPTQVGEWVTFTATVAALRSKSVPAGTVQFILDGAKVGGPVKLDSRGRATWETSRLKVGNHRVAAIFTPRQGSDFLASTSPKKLHTVKRCICEPTTERK
jgi:lysyl endopeptidase